MTKQKHILDNQKRSVSSYLRQHLSDAEIFRLVSAYFSIHGYGLLQDELNNLKDVRFLYGDPTSTSDLDPGDKEEKYFKLTEQGLSPVHQLQQKYLAQQCAKWVKRRNVQIRSVRKSNFLHGKMYLTESPKDGAAIVGSSNFTKSGLGGGARANLEINLATSDEEINVELREWFDELWENKRQTEDVKAKVLATLNRIGENHAPEFVYYKTLYELFKDDIDALEKDNKAIEGARLKEKKIWETLYDFQKHGAQSAIRRLLRFNGCILADSVGLGKTYTALAVIKFFELKYNANVLVLCPKKLEDNWKIYSSRFNQKNNPLAEDRFNYHLMAHTDLTREKGEVSGASLENYDWSNFYLVVIDESHNFRNARENRIDENGKIISRTRYGRLFEDIIQKGGKTKVLMLSATPVNTSLIDLRNQITLMTGKDEGAFRSLGINNYNTLLNSTQKRVKEWEQLKESRNKEMLIEKLGGEFFNLLDKISIARSRQQIKRFYPGLIKKIGGFPEHEKPKNHNPPTDLKKELSYESLYERISGFSFAIYRPSDYVQSEEVKERLKQERERYNFNQEDREHFLINMMRVNFLKRLESSAHALQLTLSRTVEKMDKLIEKIHKFEETNVSSALVDVYPDEDDEDKEFLINQGRNPYHMEELDLVGWEREISKDRKILEECRLDVDRITPERDGKLKRIKEDICKRMQKPTTDKDGKLKRKMLVFTTFKDTALYLHENLEKLAKKLNFHIAMISGSENKTTFGDNKFNDILTNFSPQSRKRSSQNEMEAEIDLLIATDCISEGQNLQDCDTVLNYDIHWNPVRLIQRFGRVDRIGSRNKSVKMINYWPTEDMDLYLKLQHRVEARMVLADAVATGDDNQLNPDEFSKEQKRELGFRDKQLIEMREKVMDLDEFSDGVVISDFSIGDFLSQLRRYLKGKEEQLESTPNGIYALTKSGNTAQHGIIFLFRHKNAGKNSENPIQPFYIIFIHDSGEVRYRYMHAKKVLDLFDSLCSEETEPLLDLCDAFDEETQHGKEMSHYNEMMEKCVAAIAETFNRQVDQRMGKSGFILPEEEEYPKNIEDFELITWLIIKRCE